MAATRKTSQSRRRAIRNPVPAQRLDLYPNDPNYPIRAMVIRGTGQRFSVVSLKQDNGRYVAEVLDNPSLRATAATRQAAERKVAELYAKQHSRIAARRNWSDVPLSDTPEEDEADMRVIRRRRKQKTYSWEQVKREDGYLEG